MEFLIVPTLSCPSRCAYCFSPNRGPMMSSQMGLKVLEHVERIHAGLGEPSISIVFHGGEPLLAGHAFFEIMLDKIGSRFSGCRTSLGIQSNLWLLDDEYCRIFAQYGVWLGTSLDGPESITDSQRGAGYFKKTMRGIRLAQDRGLSPGCITTFSSKNSSKWRQVCDFFFVNRIDFSIHAAAPSLDPGGNPAAPTLSPSRYGTLLCRILDAYCQNRKEISISTLDGLVASLSGSKKRSCTFSNCLGRFLAYDPSGGIFPCQRFCGLPEYSLGRLEQGLTYEELMASRASNKFKERFRRVESECDRCSYFSLCRGGCPYNAWAGKAKQSARDPYCPAFKKVFGHAQRKLLKELADKRNVEAVAEEPWRATEHPILRKGPLAELCRPGAKPKDMSRAAKRIIAAVEIARSPSIDTAAWRLCSLGLCRSYPSGLASTANLRRLIFDQGNPGNLYLHVNYRCQLSCPHCYADAARSDTREMKVYEMEALINQAKSCGFQKVVVTGGEPVLHSGFSEITSTLARYRPDIAPMKLVLRTNLAMPVSGRILADISLAFDRVVVSLDGNEDYHDARRGKGSFQSAVENIESYQKQTRTIPNPAELVLAATLPPSQLSGPLAMDLLEFARKHGIGEIRTRPLLPIGRARTLDLEWTLEHHPGRTEATRRIEQGFFPRASCGVGNSLYIDPAGAAYPCFACLGPSFFLGNALRQSLRTILMNPIYVELSNHNVDRDPGCNSCELRYLCGGTCRAQRGSPREVKAIPAGSECGGRKEYYLDIVKAAQEYLRLDFKDREGRYA